MNNQQLIPKIRSAVYLSIQEKGYVCSVDVLMRLGYLTKKNHDDWRKGRVQYLESVCTVNLKKLSLINKEIRKYAAEKKLKASFTDYRQWGAKQNRLRFSRSNDPSIERNYATHYVDTSKTEELKAAKKKEQNTDAQE